MPENSYIQFLAFLTLKTSFNLTLARLGTIKPISNLISYLSICDINRITH